MTTGGELVSALVRGDDSEDAEAGAMLVAEFVSILIRANTKA